MNNDAIRAVISAAHASSAACEKLDAEIIRLLRKLKRENEREQMLSVGRIRVEMGVLWPETINAQ